MAGVALYSCAFYSGNAWAANDDGSGDPTAVKDVNGEYYDKEGNPTFKVEEDGTVDWYTYSGYLRFNSMCIVCHGPDGAGSSYAPSSNQVVEDNELRRIPVYCCARTEKRFSVY